MTLFDISRKKGGQENFRVDRGGSWQKKEDRMAQKNADECIREYKDVLRAYSFFMFDEDDNSGEAALQFIMFCYLTLFTNMSN